METSTPVQITMTGRRHKWIIVGAVLILAVVMTLKYFPGLENEPVYAGVAYQTIHPDAFQGDPYRSPDLPMSSRIIQLSLMYGLVKLAGDIWLDDRFLALVYACLVAIGLVGVDKTARLLGATGIYERLIVLMVFARDHAVLDHKAMLAHHQDVNHTAFAIPVIVWLFYAVLARKGLPLAIALSVLLLATSIRNAPIPIVMAMAVVMFTGKPWERRAVAMLSVCGMFGAYWVLTQLMAVPEEGRLALWDILRNAAGGDVNPFDEAFYAPGRFAVVNIVWLSIIAAALVLATGGCPAFTGIRIIMIGAALTWLIGGAYISFSPDALKFPLLQGIAPTRALAWPQNLAYIALFCVAFRQLRDHQGSVTTVAIISALAALFVIGPGNIGQWAGLLLASLMVVLLIHIFRAYRTSGISSARHGLATQLTANRCLLIAQTLAVTLSVTYAVGIANKLPAWTIALQTGVFGDAAPARWIGVAEYVNERTPINSVVLPIAAHPQTGAPKVDRSFGTRSGRAMPVPEDFPGNFRTPDSWQAAEKQKQVIARIEAGIATRDYCAAAVAIMELTPRPDYIAIAQALIGDTDNRIGHYATSARINNYLLFKHNPTDSSNCKAR